MIERLEGRNEQTASRTLELEKAHSLAVRFVVENGSMPLTNACPCRW